MENRSDINMDATYQIDHSIFWWHKITLITKYWKTRTMSI